MEDRKQKDTKYCPFNLLYLQEHHRIMPFFSRLAIFVMAATSFVKGQTTPTPIPDGGSTPGEPFSTIRSLVRNWCNDIDKQSIITQYGSIEDWDTSQVTDMSNVFRDLSNCNPNITDWDTSSVTTFSTMVGGCGQMKIDKRLVPGFLTLLLHFAILLFFLV